MKELKKNKELYEYEKKLRLIQLYAIKTTIFIFMIFLAVWSILEFFGFFYTYEFRLFGIFGTFYFLFFILMLIQRKIRIFKHKGGEEKDKE
ncbi:MAG: hypothetical protein KAQ84_04495 [Thermoplasmatales archaeon]|nr:hypothetical protein [Thermoplasmatales archaeon]